MKTGDFPSWSCATTPSGSDRILLAHGEGGRLARQLIRQHMLPPLGSPDANDLPDAFRLPISTSRLAFSTDGYIVTPLFFPGGDIGSLAIHGTANDLCVAGAKPRWISLSLVIEEGLPIEVLDRVMASVARTAEDIGVTVVTGDTKVAPKGAVDKLFVTTAGIGELIDPVPPGPQALIEGDVLIATGPIGRHGMAILCSREEIAFDPPPTSDVGDLFPAVDALRQARIGVRAMRDATRGGVAAVLHEWAHSCQRTLVVRERDLPVSPEVRGASELLGLDPIFLACEGVMLAAVHPEDADRALKALRSTKIAAAAVVIGRVESQGIVPVVMENPVGRRRSLDEPVLPAMPRIC